MKKTILCASIASMIIATTNAATIGWQTPEPISGVDDVNDDGTYFGSWTLLSGGGTVGGVTFGNSDLINTDDLLHASHGDFGNAGTPDTTYNDLLQGARYAGHNNDYPNLSFTLGNVNPLTIGHEYLLQFWVSDARDGINARSLTLSGSDDDLSDSIGFGDGGNGHYIIGTFIADGTTQTITVNIPDDSSSYQVNLLQLRTIAIPEPSSIGLAGLGLLGAAFRRRRAR